MLCVFSDLELENIYKMWILLVNYTCRWKYLISMTCHSLFVILRLQEDPPVGVSGAPSENNIMQWNAVIFG